MEFTYDSSSRAIAIFDKAPNKAELDGIDSVHWGDVEIAWKAWVTLTVLPGPLPETF